MIRVTFTKNLERHLHCPATDVGRAEAETVRDALERVFAGNPAARSYVLDDQNALRQHMMVYVNGRPIADRTLLTDAVKDGDEVYVMQALSGG